MSFRNETAPMGPGRLREVVHCAKLNANGDSKTLLNFQAHSRLIFLDPSIGSAGMAGQLRRELGDLGFAHLRRAIADIGNDKPPLTIDGGRP